MESAAKMKDEAKSKRQLIAEMVILRQRVVELEGRAAERQQIEIELRQRTAQLETLR